MKLKIPKPKVVLLYNQFKAGVDLVDQKTGSYSCQRKTRRWTMALFMNLLDVVTHNAFILFTTAESAWKAGHGSRKKLFLEWLAKELCVEHVKQRLLLPGHNLGTKGLMYIFIDNFEEHYEGVKCPTARCEVCQVRHDLQQCRACSRIVCISHGAQRDLYRCKTCNDEDSCTLVLQSGQKRCGFCPRSLDRTAKVYCCACTKFVCPDHERFSIQHFICKACKAD